MTLFAPLGANLFLLFAALSLGTLLLPLLRKDARPIDRAAVALVGGLGLLGTLLFCVGLVHFSRLWIVLTLSASILVGGRSLLAELRSWQHPAVSREHWPVLPAAVLLLVFAVTAIGGFAEPVGDMNNDTVAYHYLGPRVWLRQEVIRPVPDEVLTFFPVLVETQYAALMALGGDGAPGLFSVVHLFALVLAAAVLALRVKLDPRAAWWVAALLACMPAAYRGAYGGFLDALFAAFVLLAARWAFDAGGAAGFALGGAFCGFALGTKYTGIIAAGLVLGCVSVLLISQRRSVGFMLRSLACAIAVAAVFAAPFYLRNWIAYGCPIYPPPPALLHVFTAKGISPHMLHELTKNVTETGAGMGRGLAHFMLLPFNLTFHTANFRGAGGIGLVPWALAPFGIIALRRDRFARGLLLFAFLFCVAWFLTAQVSRYLIPVYAIALLFGVAGWQSVARIETHAGRILCAVVVAISLGYGLYMIVPERADDMHAAVSHSFREQRRLRDVRWSQGFDFLNQDPSVTRVLLLDENIGPYFLTKDYVKPFGRWGEQTIPGVTSVADVVSSLGALRVSHVFDVRFEGGSFKLTGSVAGLTPVFSGKDEIVYRVEPELQRTRPILLAKPQEKALR